MKAFSTLVILSFICVGVHAQTKVPAKDMQVKTALMAAPPDKRDSAAVYGFTDDKKMVMLRKGLNEYICVTDDPFQAGFSVSCYHRDLQPFMQRGRDLRVQGKSVQETFDAREKEVKAGTLAMPKQPSTLFVFSAKEEDFDKTTGEVKNGYLRSVIYIPYATAQSTGLPLKPQAPGMPWIMHPGTHGAHIMINPPVVK